MEVEKPTGGMKAETLSCDIYIIGYLNKLLGMWTRRAEEPSLEGVVDASAVEVVSGARVRGERPCFLGRDGNRPGHALNRPGLYHNYWA